jgi:ParB family chromosome partitioning protein
MARRPKPPSLLDRGQRGRPQPPAGTVAQREGERALPGAMLVPIEQLVPDPTQPRHTMDPERLAELAASISEHGVLQPLLVREDGFLDDGRARFMIVAGGRRHAAAQQAGLSRVPVLLRESEAEQVRILQLTENIQREDLDPVEEARAIKELMDLRFLSSRSMAEMLHRSHTYVANRLKLIEREDVAEALGTPGLTPTVALEIAREEDATARRDLLQRARTERLRQEDVQQIRREGRRRPAAAAPPAGGTPTLREVAEAMGATEAQVKAAAQARRDEPDLTPAEALALAMHAAPSVSTETPTPPAIEAIPSITDQDNRTFRHLVAAAGGPAAVLHLVTWARLQKLTWEQLEERCRTLLAIGNGS